jgi:hypothetical protein
MNKLLAFGVDRVKSLVSKKVGAAALTATAASAGASEGTIYTGIAYIVCQTFYDCFKLWVESKN